jgi:hypothetical protein
MIHLGSVQIDLIFLFLLCDFSSANANYSDWSPPDFAYCKSSKANGEPAFLALSAQPARPITKQPALMLPPAHLPEYSEFVGVMPTSQQASEIPYHLNFTFVLKPETCVKSLTGESGLQGSISASPSPRPFYSFLPPGPLRCERPLGECRADVSEGVDLELRL